MIRARLVLLGLGALACGRHDHGAGDHPRGKEEDELPGRSATIWTEKNELFMEYAPLVVGKESGFAAHVTVLPSFKAATAGVVTVLVRQADGQTLEARADAPKSPGIFRPAITPTAAGACSITVTIERDGARDVLPVEGCTVHPDEKGARAAIGDEAEPTGRITYLKEQAWKTEFASAPVGERELLPAIRVNGEIKPLAGKEARLTAPATGRVVLTDPGPVLGAPVAKGQLLASVTLRLEGAGDRAGLEAEALAARAEVTAAETQLARAERLFAQQAIPEKQVEEARTRVTVAKARLSGAAGRVAQVAASASGRGGPGRGALRIRSPLAGTLVAVSVTTGQTVGEGDPMFVVIDLARVWLEARVFEPDIPKVEAAKTAWFTIEGYEEPFSVEAANGRLVTVGRVIDPATRTVPVVFELANADGRLRIGQFAKVWIATGAPVKALAIPESALIEDAAKPVAYVQVEGEAFERRQLTVGIRSQGWVEVKEGLAPGERVVVKGAYEIKLASAAGSVPAHGHAH